MTIDDFVFYTVAIVAFIFMVRLITLGMGVPL